MRRRALPYALLAGTALLMGAIEPPRIVDSWSEESENGFFRKVIIVAITEDRQARRQFEGKFINHLRSRGIAGVASFELVPDLTAVTDREKIIAAIKEQQITGAISVRLVSLQETGEEEWAAAWKESLGPELTLREVVRSTEPIEIKKTKRYGVEITVWNTETRAAVWSGRTGMLKRKQVLKGGGSFVEGVLTLLEQKGILRE